MKETRICGIIKVEEVYSYFGFSSELRKISVITIKFANFMFFCFFFLFD